MLLQPDVVVVVQVIHPEDLVALSEEQLGGACPDKAGDSSDEEIHGELETQKVEI
jgi:hypothetical protein